MDKRCDVVQLQLRISVAIILPFYFSKVEAYATKLQYSSHHSSLNLNHEPTKFDECLCRNSFASSVFYARQTWLPIIRGVEEAKIARSNREVFGIGIWMAIIDGNEFQTNCDIKQKWASRSLSGRYPCGISFVHVDLTTTADIIGNRYPRKFYPFCTGYYSINLFDSISTGRQL